jgi:hypothetical protein
MDDGRFTYPVTMQDLGTDGGVMPWERVRMACGYRESFCGGMFEPPAAERAVLRTASVLRGCRLVPVPASVLDLAAAWVAANQEPLLNAWAASGLHRAA